jgi:hypothetical protein
VSPEELLRKHLYAPVPVLSGANKNVTPDFSDLVGMMMAKDAAKRPSSMDEFMRHYQAIRVFRSTPKPPAEQTDAAGR